MCHKQMLLMFACYRVIFLIWCIYSFQLNSCVSENFFYCLAGGRSVKQSGKKPAGTIKT